MAQPGSATTSVVADWHVATAWLAPFGSATFDDLRWWADWTVAKTKAALASHAVEEVVLDGEGIGLVLGPPEETGDVTSTPEIRPPVCSFALARLGSDPGRVATVSARPRLEASWAGTTSSLGKISTAGTSRAESREVLPLRTDNSEGWAVVIEAG